MLGKRWKVMDLAWLGCGFFRRFGHGFCVTTFPESGFSGAFLVQRLLRKSKRQSMQKMNNVNSLRVAPFTLA